MLRIVKEKLPVAASEAHLTPKLEGLSLPEVVSDFVATKPSLHTRESYETTLKRFFEESGFHVLEDLHPAHTPLSEISRLIRSYLDTLTRRDAGDENRVLNPATINARAAALPSFFEWLANPTNTRKTPSAAFLAHTRPRTTAPQRACLGGKWWTCSRDRRPRRGKRK
jgi:hypothetical protein